MVVDGVVPLFWDWLTISKISVDLGETSYKKGYTEYCIRWRLLDLCPCRLATQLSILSAP